MMLFNLASILSFLAVSSLASPVAEPRSQLAKRSSNLRIKASADGQCLTGAGGKWGIGTELTYGDCDSAPTWTVNSTAGSIGSIILEPANTSPQLALDAGDGTTNNEKLTLQKSSPGLFQQTWLYTEDNRIALTGGDNVSSVTEEYQCLDHGDDGPQTYQCFTGNSNQIWYFVENEDAKDILGYPVTASV
ncbi:hypothetical protein L202_07560 [Cryptococcus amylolentus CBS 6039]|uniref:Ricin B lectin domain-containing protein n=1 Tax=Cryptococcus amylolentus CBS 6039 TaxID=1295533 RepID=A0A1E3HCN3_9TREE|nr:hypothetical protein L202_07560 [Cryptococcus amylolentus CBS 6039]ODN74100.1 hypothetical protein L202_07560 [Cryptococcus amylolentus CBS 6039]